MDVISLFLKALDVICFFFEALIAISILFEALVVISFFLEALDVKCVLYFWSLRSCHAGKVARKDMQIIWERRIDGQE